MQLTLLHKSEDLRQFRQDESYIPYVLLLNETIFVVGKLFKMIKRILL